MWELRCWAKIIKIIIISVSKQPYKFAKRMESDSIVPILWMRAKWLNWLLMSLCWNFKYFLNHMSHLPLPYFKNSVYYINWIQIFLKQDIQKSSWCTPSLLYQSHLSHSFVFIWGFFLLFLYTMPFLTCTYLWCSLCLRYHHSSPTSEFL